LKNLNLNEGDILVVNYELGLFPTETQNLIRRKLEEMFEKRGIMVLWVPKDMELSSIHIHRSNYGEGEILAVVNEKPPHRMIRVDVSELEEE